MFRAAVFWPGLVAVTALLGTLAILTGPFDRRGRMIQRYSRLWGRLGLRLAGVRVSLRLPEAPLPEAVVYVANHQSAIDIFALAGALPGQIRWVAKRELFRIPVFGRAMRAAGYVAIDRAAPRRSRAGVSLAGAALAGGASLVVFAEGTRSPDGRLRPFKRGAFAFAQKAGVPVVPVAIRGSRDILPPAGWRIHPGTVTVRVAPPIDSTGAPQTDLVARTEAAVAAMLGQSARSAA